MTQMESTPNHVVSKATNAPKQWKEIVVTLALARNQGKGVARLPAYK
jgi:hypothetical protein